VGCFDGINNTPVPRRENASLRALNSEVSDCESVGKYGNQEAAPQEKQRINEISLLISNPNPIFSCSGPNQYAHALLFRADLPPRNSKSSLGGKALVTAQS
jgi:hypothetical protein